MTIGVASFVAHAGGRSLAVPTIGEETNGHRFDIGAAEYLGVAWRYRNVLSTCVTGVSTTSPLEELFIIARAQQRRIAETRHGR